VGWVQDWLGGQYGISFPVAETCSVLRYGPDQAYRRHVDNLLLGSRFEEAQRQLPTRDISVVGYLNDDFAGGETAFDRQELQIRPKQGTVLVFPSFFTYPHQALAVTSGRKYVFTTWLYYSTAGQREFSTASDEPLLRLHQPGP
jgi:predicted 2-oxoglutarate/Fe(II)-dependent dioxygenase YbiX